MPLPIALTLTYLAVNLVLIVWLERERLHGRTPRRLANASSALRYGPPLAGAVYLVVIAGDWAFVLFVLAFFAAAFWMLDGLLAFTNTSPEAGSEAMRSGWDDRKPGASRGDRKGG